MHSHWNIALNLTGIDRLIATCKTKSRPGNASGQHGNRSTRSLSRWLSAASNRVRACLNYSKTEAITPPQPLWVEQHAGRLDAVRTRYDGTGVTSIGASTPILTNHHPDIFAVVYPLSHYRRRSYTDISIVLQSNIIGRRHTRTALHKQV